MCDCFSYNAGKGSVPSVVLDPSEYFDHPSKRVAIDHCISQQIEMLWKNRIWTEGSCCGHNGLFGDSGPSVIVSDGSDAKLAKKLLKAYDPDRNWVVKQWQLITI